MYHKLIASRSYPSMNHIRVKSSYNLLNNIGNRSVDFQTCGLKYKEYLAEIQVQRVSEVALPM